MLSVIKTAQANLSLQKALLQTYAPPLHTHELHLLHASFFLLLLRIVI